MKTDMMELKKKAKDLVLISEKKGMIKPHTEAFKDFPVEEEVHKGRNLKNKK